MSAEPLLQINNLTIHFFTDLGIVKAVDGVDLHINRGETVGLAGESGSGKSVLARSILRLIQPPGKIVDGEILFEGENLLAKTEGEMRKIRGGAIAMAFQDPLTTLNPVLRVGPQIAEAVQLHGVRVPNAAVRKSFRRGEARQRTLEMMKSVRISEVEQRYCQYPHQFSGGMRQRAVLATALACNPSLLIADEPTTALDVTVQASILELLLDAQREYGTSILLITHDLGVIDHFCEQTVIMYAGRIVEWGQTRDVLSTPKHPYTQGLLECLPRLGVQSPIHPIPGDVPDLSNLPVGCAFRLRCSHVMPACMEIVPLIAKVSENRWTRCHLYENFASRGGGAHD